ncbi:SDR family NAD(P)-dependent oxidoreductase [Microbacterium testaceum]|jgi:NAD(P)-dependent dehydrogenase (short-subunit alcohol dehydrogenase family)|nr:SDR family NAD(P)-dependent oxidoreductase [Microbacterium testaceum]MCC4250186.1 SDR family NAD(P)-dependent oxidoreductase [Microbacterium testaceum]
MTAHTDELAGRVAFVTGGASGIGYETALRLAARGARLALVDRDAAQVAEAARRIGGGHLGIVADVTDVASLDTAVTRAVDTLGGIDIVVSNAGVGSASTVRASDTDHLTRIVDINLSGQIRTVKATLEWVIARRGYIVFTCSAAVLKNTPKSSAYAAAKAGVEAFAGALRMEAASHGVDVGVFYPGWTRTPMIHGKASRSADSKSLPWPLSITSEVGDVADAYAQAIVERARTAYFPRIHRYLHWIRPLYTNGAWDRRLRDETARNVASWEADLPPYRDLLRAANDRGKGVS